METLINWLGLAALISLMIVGVSVLAGFPVMILWNWLMPAIFGLPVITFWQGLGLSALSSLLFKNWSSNSKD